MGSAGATAFTMRYLAATLLLVVLPWGAHAATASLTIDIDSVAPVLVTLEPLEASATAPNPAPRTVYISSRGNDFVPRYQVAPVGAHLVIRNEDTLLHNTHISDRHATLLNVATPRAFQDVTKILPREGLFMVRCDLHQWMKAWIAVTDAPFHVLLEDKGEAVFEALPPGTFRLRVWRTDAALLERVVGLEAGTSRRRDLKGIPGFSARRD